MDIGIGACGIVCAECQAYLATQAKDVVALRQCAKTWSEIFHGVINPDDCLCDGCLSEGGWHGTHCGECEIRTCVIAHGVANCAWCAEFGCERIAAFMQQVPEARRTLEQIRRETG